jgi:predicted nucleic acid-binding Zn finger protein
MEVKFNVSENYEVCLNPISCTCPDFLYRRKHKGQFCKHIKKILELVTNE